MSRCKLTTKDLINRVEVFHPVRTSDGLGGFTREWESAGVTAGKIQRANALDARFAEMIGATQTAKLQLRRQMAPLPEGTRLVVDGQEYELISYDPPPRGGLFITAYIRKPEDGRNGEVQE